MNVDGSDLRIIAEFDYQVLQPVVDPTGRWVHYTAKAPFFPLVAQFRLDLVTGESTNISAIERPERGFDSDPFLTTQGDRLLFVNNNPNSGAEIKEMNPDGTDRTDVTTDKYFNTDPTVTRDGRLVAISSYRGPGAPSDKRPEDWFVTVQIPAWRLRRRDRPQRGRELRAADADRDLHAQRDVGVPAAVHAGPARGLLRRGPGHDADLHLRHAAGRQ